MYLSNCRISCKEGGGCRSGSQSSITLVNCKIIDCGAAALEVLEGGCLTDTGSHLYNNSVGALLWKATGAVLLQGTRIDTCAGEGVHIARCEVPSLKHPQQQQLVSLVDCSVHHCGTYGVSCDGGGALLSRCSLFENGFQGCIIKSGAHVTVKDCSIVRNKRRGLFLGLNGDAPVSITGCTIQYNRGPGLRDEARNADIRSRQRVQALSRAQRQQMQQAGQYTSTAVPTLADNIISDNGESIVEIDSRVCSFCNSSEGKMQCCRQCLRAYYCSRECQVAAWKLHKLECKLLAEKLLVLRPCEVSTVLLLVTHRHS
jgi:Right handed beta helix region/MYND finger